MTHPFRYYQTEADNAIYQELQENDKCIVKMFCGTGKSLLMRYCKIVQNKTLIVYVFPSLSLIDQFYTDYLGDYSTEDILRISSEKGSTTDAIEIGRFLASRQNRIICITYQSFETLITNLGELRINVCIFDEAHHAVGETYQKLIFENDFCEKQIFFTATPKNTNGIIMYDSQQLDAGMCGRLVYDYSYLKGVNEDYLNPFEIRIDMYTENTNRSVYESIARAYFETGNGRILPFHSDVNTDRDTSVLNFANEPEFKRVFKEIHRTEFPHHKMPKKISMIAMTASIDVKKRRQILNKFDTTPDNEVMVISSCETIGEGIDTKNANMCVFVDPKSSYVKIIQNIGRIVRKVFGVDKPKSTILIPCWVDKSKYLECGSDREKCDEVIRQDMSAVGGNFNGILNVMSALKQEDEDLYDICLHYPDKFSPQEIRSNLEKQGFSIGEVIGDGGVIETLEDLLDTDIDYDDYEYCDTTEDMIIDIAENNDVCIEIHTDSLENPVVRYNSECESGEIVRLYKSVCEDEELEEDDVYMPILAKCGEKRTMEKVNEPKRENRMRVNVHTNPDVKVLWKITGDFDITKDICSCVIDCDVVDKWYENFEATKMFIEDNERRPTSHSTTKNDSERVLGKWLSHQITNYNKKDRSMKDEKKYNLWTEFLEEYCIYFKSFDEEWYDNFAATKKFINYNKKKPCLNGTCKDITERVLGKWLSHQITNYNKKDSSIKDEKKYNLWTEFLEEYCIYFKSFDKEWYKNFENAKIFIDTNYKMPLVSDNATLRSWILTSHQNYKTKSRSMKDENKYNLWTDFLNKYNKYLNLKLTYKKKEKPNEAIWSETFKNVKMFIGEKKRKPSSKSKNITEKKLGQWVDDQQKYYKKKERLYKDESIYYTQWTAFLEEYHEYMKSRTDNWAELFESLKIFIKENEKQPSQISKDNTEKRLGQWLSKQNDQYKNKTKGMKDKNRYNQWTIFLKEYTQYMSPNKITDNASETTSITISNTVVAIKKKSMKLPKPSIPIESPEQKRQRHKTELSTLHQHYKRLTSQHLNQEFNSDPALWHKYHEISEANEQSFPESEIPRNRIIQELNKIKTKRTKLVVDMGCGKADISKYFASDPRFNFINYDHISSNDTVESCDIANTPLEDDSVEICILSLAMWGSNCIEYVEEANRILESGGKLYIIEPTKRWSEKDENGNILPEKEGMKLKELLEKNGFKIVEQSVQKFCMFVGIKV